MQAEFLAAEPAHYQILKKPVITEKSASSGELVVKVDPRASKDDIRVAVERIFKVKVKSVRTATYMGKPKRAGRSSGRRAGYKKAFIALVEGYKVELIEGV
jgi:large subunit ribosomal protein L23